MPSSDANVLQSGLIVDIFSDMGSLTWGIANHLCRVGPRRLVVFLSAVNILILWPKSINHYSIDRSKHESNLDV